MTLTFSVCFEYWRSARVPPTAILKLSWGRNFGISIWVVCVIVWLNSEDFASEDLLSTTVWVTRSISRVSCTEGRFEPSIAPNSFWFLSGCLVGILGNLSGYWRFEKELSLPDPRIGDLWSIELGVSWMLEKLAENDEKTFFWDEL